MAKIVGKTYNTKPTAKQKRAIDKIVETRGVISKAMREAGYKDKTAKNPKNLTESKAWKKELKPLLDRLEAERDRAIKLMKGKISKAKYKDLVDGVDKLTKNIQLLSGGKTGNVGISLTEALKKADESNE